MMAENPPAFPLRSMYLEDGRGYAGQRGMSLRDWFAGQALPHVIDVVTTGKASLADWEGTPAQTAAAISYAMADAMLAEREKAQGDRP